MKNAIITLLVLASLYSCTKESDDTLEPVNYVGSWKLVKMTGNWIGSEYTGSDMAWQETYLINDDATFTKTRVNEDTTIIASGTYNFAEDGLLDESEVDIRTYIVFTYDAPNNIIGSCFSNSTTENLYFDSKNKLISTWNACDGPGLEYAKK